MFRPFVGEIIDAKLKEFDKDGLRCMSQSAHDTRLRLLLLLSSEYVSCFSHWCKIVKTFLVKQATNACMCLFFGLMVNLELLVHCGIYVLEDMRLHSN